MTVLSWNCRGLGNPRAVSVLVELVKTHYPDVVFLSETLVDSHRMEEVRVKIKFEVYIAVPARGRSGGLCMLWREKDVVQITHFQNYFINANSRGALDDTFRVTGFYGSPERERRKESWDLLRRLNQVTYGPWCVVGDFHDILHQYEQKGRHERLSALVDRFREAVADCNFVDVELYGYPFTWARAKGQPHGVESQLDRALVKADWVKLFPQGVLRNLVAPTSNHSPIILLTTTNIHGRRRWKFRFENAWRREEPIRPLVEDVWNRPTRRNFFLVYRRAPLL
ncbi:hypothetical protein LINGRAHAP2_LOCUS14879 [Linum grandiflorum]